MTDTANLKVYSVEDVAKHNTVDDIWVVYNGLVYDVSRFIDEHPGGEEVLADVAGTDATADFDDIGHSDDAHEILRGLLIGKIDGGVTKEIKTQIQFEKLSSLNTPLIIGAVLVAGAGAYFFLQN